MGQHRHYKYLDEEVPPLGRLVLALTLGSDVEVVCRLMKNTAGHWPPHRHQWNGMTSSWSAHPDDRWREAADWELERKGVRRDLQDGAE